MALDVRDVTGASTGTVDLDEKIFGIQPNVPVLHQVVTAQLAAARAGTQSTKTRAEVSGGGRKPFKQKGTGRARQGSERAPHFTGGGIALGPKPRSYRQRTPRKMIQLALRSALSDRAAEGKVVVVERWPWEAPSTRDARQALEALGLDGRILVVLSRDDEAAGKSFRNLPGVQLLLAGELNAYDVLCNDWIVFTAETLPGASAPVEAVASVESGADRAAARGDGAGAAGAAGRQ
jgi:large subunit ribosomal protein L4